MAKHVLIIAEKPTAAERIAEALDKKSKPKAHREKGAPYFVAERDRKIVVVPALGHLYVVGQSEGQKNRYPAFDLKWFPKYMIKRDSQQSKIWIATISRLAQNADVFIDGCDYDIEGSLIGYNILNYACGKADIAKRMKYSTLTKADLEHAYERLSSKLDFNIIEAGRTRHEIDWLYGINLSRALISAIKRVSGSYTALSTGRVQGPTLRFLVLRENAIACFVPTPYWTIKTNIEVEGKTYKAEYEKKTIRTKAQAEAIIEACQGTPGETTKIEEKIFKQDPLAPFDLSTLQSEAYRLFDLNPKQTARIAERLYLNALISYPRTSSQKLPSTIDFKLILTKLGTNSTFQKLASDLLTRPILQPKDGKRDDPAHPAIHPTGNSPERKLRTSEKKLWNLIVRRFMAAFGDPAIKQSLKAEIEVNGHHFYLHGHKILSEGWMRFYKPYIRSSEIFLPKITEGRKVEIESIICEDKFTHPPVRFNPNSLLQEMETQQIGTKATRADVIQTLYDRNYIAERSIKVTELGQKVTEILQKHASTMISVEFTRALEEKMRRIQEGKEKRENVLLEAVNHLRPVLEELRRQEQAIGTTLAEAVKQVKLQKNTIGRCPSCHTGELMTLHSRKTGKRFIGCSNYFKGTCTKSFPLPQQGTIAPTRKKCKSCGSPIVKIVSRRKWPWRLCVNPMCPKKGGKRTR